MLTIGFGPELLQQLHGPPGTWEYQQAPRLVQLDVERERMLGPRTRPRVVAQHGAQTRKVFVPARRVAVSVERGLVPSLLVEGVDAPPLHGGERVHARRQRVDREHGANEQPGALEVAIVTV